MRIYTGQTFSKENLEKIKSYDMGIMLSTHAELSFLRSALKYVEGIPVALDNGAFSNFQKEQPFNEFAFLQSINEIIKVKVEPDFIVCPDIVAGGLASLEFSEVWRKRLCYKKLALVVQDGMVPHHVEPYIGKYSVLFVGGSVSWKWQNLPYWVDLAHRIKKHIHVGQVGTADRLEFCKELGVDSCDSTSFVRNGAWHILEEYRNPTQIRMF